MTQEAPNPRIIVRKIVRNYTRAGEPTRLDRAVSESQGAGSSSYRGDRPVGRLVSDTARVITEQDYNGILEEPIEHLDLSRRLREVL